MFFHTPLLPVLITVAGPEMFPYKCLCVTEAIEYKSFIRIHLHVSSNILKGFKLFNV